MKKLSALFLCSALLLSGCNRDVQNSSSRSEKEETVQTTETEQNTTVTTTATTTAKTTSSPEIIDDIPNEEENELPEGYDYIVPKKSNLKATVIVDKSTILPGIIGEIGYELPGIDLENDEHYVAHMEYVEANYTGEELEISRNMNYFEHVGQTSYYIGSEQTDWAVIVDYNIGSQISTYSRIVCVKDGEIVHASEAFDVPCAWNYSDGQFITPAGEKGICIYDISKRKANYISNADDGTELFLYWYAINSINDRYVIFTNEPETSHRSTYLYDRRSGSVTRMKDYSFDPYQDRWSLDSSKLYYYDDYKKEYSVYDLITQEYTVLDTDDLTDMLCMESGDYIVTSADKSKPNYVSGEAVVITRISDGAEKAFDLREFFDDNTPTLIDFYADGNWLYFITYEETLALNYNSTEVAEISVEADFMRHIIFPANELITENGRITLIVDGNTYVAQMISPQIVLLDYDGSIITPDSSVTISDGAYREPSDILFDPTEDIGFASVTCSDRVWLTDPTDGNIKRYSTNDTVYGLTVGECSTFIDIINGKSCFNGGYVRYDGSIEITGEAWLETEGLFLCDKGDIFIKLDDSCHFPTIDYSDYTANRTIHITNGIAYPEEITSLLPPDGSKVRVKAVISEISAEYLLDSRRSGGVGTWATLTSLELFPENQL